ncbi:MAG: glutamate--tRNA ligase family protein, partial [Gammaproteobacteria bacterium]|nr:glutamate--tRNA ligase family protein [Gammaproteobacteria bacterium]
MHLGTLAAAVVSYLHAKPHGGEWLVRIEDVDPPREVAGAADAILRTLDAFSLHWDRDVLYQSTRLDLYRATAERLLAADEAFRCRCSRQQVRLDSDESGRYPGTCRALRLADPDTSIRLRVQPGGLRFTDRLQGEIERDIEISDGDFVIFRRDRLPAYHLAVVLDDAEQGITAVVRGFD